MLKIRAWTVSPAGTGCMWPKSSSAPPKVDVDPVVGVVERHALRLKAGRQVKAAVHRAHALDRLRGKVVPERRRRNPAAQLGEADRVDGTPKRRAPPRERRRTPSQSRAAAGRPRSSPERRQSCPRAASAPPSGPPWRPAREVLDAVLVTVPVYTEQQENPSPHTDAQFWMGSALYAYADPETFEDPDEDGLYCFTPADGNDGYIEAGEADGIPEAASYDPEVSRLFASSGTHQYRLMEPEQLARHGPSKSPVRGNLHATSEAKRSSTGAATPRARTARDGLNLPALRKRALMTPCPPTSQSSSEEKRRRLEDKDDCCAIAALAFRNRLISLAITSSTVPRVDGLEDAQTATAAAMAGAGRAGRAAGATGPVGPAGAAGRAPRRRLGQRRRLPRGGVRRAAARVRAARPRLPRRARRPACARARVPGMPLPRSKSCRRCGSSSEVDRERNRARRDERSAALPKAWIDVSEEHAIKPPAETDAPSGAWQDAERVAAWPKQCGAVRPRPGATAARSL